MISFDVLDKSVNEAIEYVKIEKSRESQKKSKFESIYINTDYIYYKEKE